MHMNRVFKEIFGQRGELHLKLHTYVRTYIHAQSVHTNLLFGQRGELHLKLLDVCIELLNLLLPLLKKT